MPVSLIQGNVLLGLLAAFFWGGGDFSGGMGAKYAGGTVRSAVRVILVSHSASLCILLIIAALRGDSFPQGVPFLCGVAAGVTGGLSLVGFYIALARGAMGSAAAISGLVAAAIPATVSIVSDGSPGGLRLAGFAAAGVAIWLVAGTPGKVFKTKPVHRFSSTTALALLSGAGFGVYFVLLKFAGTAGIAWPMVTARMGSLTTCSLLTLFLSARPPDSSNAAKLPRAAILWSLSTALLDTAGNLLFISSTRAGRLDIAAVLASLYPATTILLAVIVLRERFTRRQGFGMAVAALAVAMITL